MLRLYILFILIIFIFNRSCTDVYKIFKVFDVCCYFYICGKVRHSEYSIVRFSEIVTRDS